MFQLPPPVRRPKLAELLFARDVDYRQAAAALGSSRETIRLICMPFGDVRRRVPNARLMSRIVTWTAGEVRPADFYEVDLEDVAA